MLEEIVNAIRKQRMLRIHYDPGDRFIEPHAIGYGRVDQVLLRTFQVEGASASGEPHNWKLFRIDRMSQVGDGGRQFFGPRPEYNPEDPVLTGGIIARL